MSKQPEDFEPLLRLLALKKFEQPPPGYFEQLSEEISARIAAEAAAPGSFVEQVSAKFGWGRRFWSELVARPGLVGALCVLASGAVIWGISSAQTAPQIPAGNSLAQAAAPPLVSPDAASLVSTTVVPTNALGINPQLPPGFFDTLYQRAGATPVDFQLR